ncbi:cell fate (sporulation/competence/biofilm development) regulator YlbF (YheA/YmcA/DUF963 family) [Brassicibacter mesophilus]
MKMNKANPLDKARELGQAIFQSSEYLALRKAEAEFHDDKDAASLLNDLKIAKERYSNFFNNEFSNCNDYSEPQLKNQIDTLQDKINHNLAIHNLYKAQENYDILIKNINNIINYITGKEKKQCSSSKCISCSCSKKNK